MESMASAALSIGSTTAMGVEDDANNFAMVNYLLYWSQAYVTQLFHLMGFSENYRA
mgnify:CR=1 FL=1